MEKNPLRTANGGISGKDMLLAFRQSGIPFQQWCVASIKSRRDGWRITHEEYPVSAGDSDTRIDFAATKDGLHVVVAECKQSDPKYKSWVFPSASQDTFEPHIEAYMLSKESHHHESFLGATTESNKPKIYRVRTHFYEGLDASPSIFAIEAKLKEKVIEKIFNAESVENACHQVTQSLIGLLAEKWDHMIARGECGYAFYYPVIFTTADLYHVQYNPLNNEIAEDAFKQVPYVVYHYGIADPLWRYKKERCKNYFGNPEKRLPIFIVNRNHINEFFDRVSSNLTPPKATT
jgi:hypothetical protein